jgi:hypothetical protein
MPPQQGKRLLDLADGSFGFCTHLLWIHANRALI